MYIMYISYWKPGATFGESVAKLCVPVRWPGQIREVSKCREHGTLRKELEVKKQRLEKYGKNYGTYMGTSDFRGRSFELRVTTNIRFSMVQQSPIHTIRAKVKGSNTLSW